MGASRARGPRGAGSDTKADILASAAILFTERGFDRTSLRAIARSAKVDPALIRHYFSSKVEVFVAALRPVPPGGRHITELSKGPPEEAGERVVRTFVTLWDHPRLGPQLRTIAVSTVSNPVIAAAMRELVLGEVLFDVARIADDGRGDDRAAACASQLLGLAIARYVIKLEPLASASPEAVVAMFAPTIQRYLTGPL